MLCFDDRNIDTMEAKNVLNLLFALLCVTSVHCGSSDKQNPCSRFQCPDKSLCWYDSSGKAQCDDPCSYTLCKSGTHCVNVVGTCGNASCKPTAKCKKVDPSNPCAGISCPNGETCTVVTPLNEGPTPICGPNPCARGQPCCDRRHSSGVCEKSGCYLEKVPCSCEPGQPCQVVPVCRDPCQVAQLQCTKPGEYCYTDNAVCITAPCNPIPVCRKPCDANLADVCDLGQKCQVLYVNCLPSSDPYKCKPKELCVPTKV